jgi:DNA-binding response OmpR family regulator
MSEDGNEIKHAPVESEPEPKYTILLVEDDQLVSEMVSSMIGRGGHKVISVDNAEDALILFKQSLDGGTPYDMVITDRGLVGDDLGGNKVLHGVKEVSPRTFVTLFSGSVHALNETEKRENPFDDYISKPARLADFRNSISKVKEYREKQA